MKGGTAINAKLRRLFSRLDIEVYEIKRATADDAELVALFYELGIRPALDTPPPFTTIARQMLSAIRANIENPDSGYSASFAFDKGKLAGVVQVQIIPSEQWEENQHKVVVIDMFVLPEYRNQHSPATALQKAVFDIADEVGTSSVIFTCLPDNKSVQHHYERIGARLRHLFYELDISEGD